MENKPSLHNHAVERLQERFRLEESWLQNELEHGRFVWLRGAGSDGVVKKVRSGHLIYIPHIDEYCIVIMDDRSRLAITVLTEDMALKSAWREGLDDASKLKAKRIALGYEAVSDSNFLHLYAQERGELSVNVCARTVSYDWEPVVLTLCKITIKAEQVNISKNCCLLADDQMTAVSKLISEKITAKEMRPCCELFVRTGRGKSVIISESVDGVFCLDDAENAKRWS